MKIDDIHVMIFAMSSVQKPIFISLAGIRGVCVCVCVLWVLSSPYTGHGCHFDVIMVSKMWGLKQAKSYVNEVECTDHEQRKFFEVVFLGKKGNTKLNIM